MATSAGELFLNLVDEGRDVDFVEHGLESGRAHLNFDQLVVIVREVAIVNLRDNRAFLKTVQNTFATVVIRVELLELLGLFVGERLCIGVFIFGGRFVTDFNRLAGGLGLSLEVV